MNMLDLIKSRRSIRKYTSEPVTDEQIKILLEATMAAPSASNRKPWEFVVVRDAGLRKQLSEVHPWAGMAAGAPWSLSYVGARTTRTTGLRIVQPLQRTCSWQ